MELLTRPNSMTPWSPSTSLLADLLAAVERSTELLLYSPSPALELDEVSAAVRLFERCGGGASRLFAATPFPDADWVAVLRRSGIGGIFVARRVRTGVVLGREVPLRVCPALHARGAFADTSCVCGAHGDRRVLADVHLARWCLADFDRCPGRVRGDG
jgi:hypothetical protein